MSEHYHFNIAPSAVYRSTKKIADEAFDFIEEKLSDPEPEKEQRIEKMLVELDGCEIRTAESRVKENSEETTPVYNNPKKEKIINWRDVRLGFVRPLESHEKTFVGKMDSYEEIVRDLHNAGKLIGMTGTTEIVGVADGGIGLREELKRQFPTMQFILDKSHLKDHFYDTAEKLGIPQKERPKWVRRQIRAISNEKVLEILKQLQQLYDKEPNARLNRLIGYIKRFRNAVNYSEFKEKGYPIGSGEIESAHKSVP